MNRDKKPAVAENKVVRFLVGFCIFLLSTHGDATAQNFWQQTKGPYGGTIEDMAINASGHLFVSTYLAGIYRSTNNGDSWTAVGSGLPKNTSWSLASAPITQNIFAYSGDHGLYRSTDNGESWEKLTPGSLYFGAMTISPSGDIFAGDYNGIFRSTDNGESWMSVYTDSRNANVYSIAIHSNGHIFAAVHIPAILYLPAHNYLVRSLDNGQTWIGSLSTFESGGALAINSSGHVFLSANRRLFRSVDDGGSWTKIADGLFSRLVINASDHIFSTSDDSGVLRSTDNGENWLPINNGLPLHDIGPLAINAKGHIFVGTTSNRIDGIFRSTDNGESWMRVNTGLTNVGVNAIVFNAKGDIFAGTQLGGIFRSTDQGESWLSINAGMTRPVPIVVQALAINAGADIFAGIRFDGIFLTADDGVFRSTDNGDSWTRINFGLGDWPICAFAINMNGHIFAGAGSDGVFRSTNNGDSWTPVNAGLDTYDEVCALAINPITQDIFAGTTFGIFRSTDNGASWKLVAASQMISHVKALAVNANGHIFAGTANDGVFRSTDNGASWTHVNIGSAYPHIRSVVINTKGHVFVADYGDGVYLSKDNGDSWTSLNTGLSNTIFGTLAISGDGHIFAGTAAGIFRSVQPTTGVKEIRDDLPASFLLEQNYPNPFSAKGALGNPTTMIAFSLPRSGHATMQVFNLLGETIATLVDAEMKPGRYQIRWETPGIRVGVYFYRLRVGNFVQTRRLILMK